MSQVTLITTKGGKPTPYRDSVLSFAMKGGDKNSATIMNFQGSLPLGKPYGIIQTTYSNPLSLSFNESTRKVFINPGVFMAYGRLCEIEEQGEVMDFSSITPASTDRVFYVVYVVIDVNDAVVNSISIRLTEPTAQPVNIDALQDQDDLYLREYGVFMMPIAQFSYSPIQSGGHYFADYQRIPEVFDEDTIQIAGDVLEEGTIGGYSVQQMLEHNDNGRVLPKFKKASNVDAEADYESQERRLISDKKYPGIGDNIPGYSIAEIGNAFGEVGNSIELPSDMSGMVTYKRFKLLDLTNSFAENGFSFEKILPCDCAHLMRIRIMLRNAFIKAKGKYVKYELFGIENWFGSRNGLYADTDTLSQLIGGDVMCEEYISYPVRHSYSEFTYLTTTMCRLSDGKWGSSLCGRFYHRETNSKNFLLFWGEFQDEAHQREGYRGFIDANYVSQVYTNYMDLIVEDVGNDMVKITMTGLPSTGRLSHEGEGSWYTCEFLPLEVEEASGSILIEFTYFGNAFGD